MKYKGIIRNGMTFKFKDKAGYQTLIFVDKKFGLLAITDHVIPKLTAPMFNHDENGKYLYSLDEIRSMIDYRIDVTLCLVNPKTDRRITYFFDDYRMRKRK